jgi:hypothetical protein
MIFDHFLAAAILCVSAASAAPTIGVSLATFAGGPTGARNTDANRAEREEAKQAMGNVWSWVGRRFVL